MIDVIKGEVADLPEKFFKVSSRQLIDLYPRPTILHLNGVSPEAVYVAVLLHGNEFSGWEAVKSFLKEKQKLSKSLILFIGNVRAAVESKRVLPDQEDYNRVWAGGASLEHSMAEQVLSYLKDYTHIFAALDIHNNTGRNPLYACVNKIHAEDIRLASLFSSRVVFFLEPSQVQSVALAQDFPSVTLECGKPGNKNGINKTVEMLESLMELKSLNDVSISLESEVQMFHTVAKLSLVPGVRLSFDRGDKTADLWGDENLENYNFEFLKKGTRLLHLKKSEKLLRVFDETGKDLSEEYLEIEGQAIVVKKGFIPSMFTKNTEVIEQDCFGYIMEKMKLLEPL